MDLKMFLYSRWGEQLCRITPYAASHSALINGQDTLEFSCNSTISKGDRVLWSDGYRWREHVVCEIEQTHPGDKTTCRCTSSLISELSCAHIRVLTKTATAEELLNEILKETRFSADVASTDAIKLVIEQQSAYEALCSVAGRLGYEFESEIELNGAGVVRRLVRLVPTIGRKTATRFTYGASLQGITKTILSDDVITAAYGYGDGSGASRLWCQITDEDALDMWGIPDGAGGRRHVWGVYENSDITRIDDLKTQTLEYLKTHCTPQVSYETDIPYLSLRNVQLGDTVQVIDKDFIPPLRLEARIGEFSRDLITGETSSATFGTVTSILPDVAMRSYQAAKTAVSLAGSASATITDQITQGVITASLTAPTITLTSGEGDGAVFNILSNDVDGNVCVNGRRVVFADEIEKPPDEGDGKDPENPEGPPEEGGEEGGGEGEGSDETENGDT